MIGNLLLLSATGCFGAVLYFLKKEKFYSSIFDDVRQAKSFHMDYVQDIQHLPLNKYLILFGPPKSLNNQKFYATSFIKKSDEKDRLWSFTLRDSFTLETASLQKLTVQSSPKQKVLAFNLPPTGRELKNNQLQERAIIDNIAVCCYGMLRKTNDKYIFNPKLIIGNKHESLLVHLDEHLVSLGKKSRNFGVLGLGLVFGHAFYRFAINPPKKSKIEMQIDQFPNKQ